MPSVSVEQTRRRFRSLPSTLQDAMFSVQTAEIIRTTTAVQNIPKEKVPFVAGPVGLVLLGFIHPEDLAKEIADRAGVAPQVAATIANALDAKIFKPLTSEIHAAYAPLPHDHELIATLTPKPIEEIKPVAAAPPKPIGLIGQMGPAAALPAKPIGQTERPVGRVSQAEHIGPMGPIGQIGPVSQIGPVQPKVPAKPAASPAPAASTPQLPPKPMGQAGSISPIGQISRISPTAPPPVPPKKPQTPPIGPIGRISPIDPMGSTISPMSPIGRESPPAMLHIEPNRQAITSYPTLGRGLDMSGLPDVNGKIPAQPLGPAEMEFGAARAEPKTAAPPISPIGQVRPQTPPPPPPYGGLKIPVPPRPTPPPKPVGQISQIGQIRPIEPKVPAKPVPPPPAPPKS